MSAKPAKKSAAKSPSLSAAATPAVAAATIAPASVPAAVAAAADAPPPAWIDSPDPKKKRLGQAVIVGVWLYVAALWLLAADQYFNLGIFGPKIPPLP